MTEELDNEELEEEPKSELRVRSGIDWEKEDAANQILRESRKGVTKLSDKKFWLTEEQLALRQSREVYNQFGVPDARLVSGLYRRAHNPLAGRRPTRSRTSDDG